MLAFLNISTVENFFGKRPKVLDRHCVRYRVIISLNNYTWHFKVYLRVYDIIALLGIKDHRP